MTRQSNRPKAFGWGLALALAMLLLPAVGLWAEGSGSDDSREGYTSSADEPRPVPFNATDPKDPLANDLDTPVKPGGERPIGPSEHWERGPAAGAPTGDTPTGDVYARPEGELGLPGSNLPPLPQHTGPVGCDQTISATMGDCAGNPDCQTWVANGRIFRDGVAADECGNNKACPGGDFNPGTAFNYQAYYFNGDDSGCECIVVDTDNGACGTNVHFSLFQGVVPSGGTWACSGPDYNYLGDQGGSLSTNDIAAELPPGAVGNSDPGDYTVLAHNNFSVAACQFGFTISCVPSESLRCALAPIETKIDNLDGAGGGKKVALCHIPPGNPDNAHVIEVGAHAVEAHMMYHGDCLSGDSRPTKKEDRPCECPNQPNIPVLR